GKRKGLTFYSFRHGFATHFLEQGGAPSDLQEILGHASMTTTDHYVRMVSARAAASMQALDYGLDEANVRTPCVPEADSGSEGQREDVDARTA
ncbi:MAG: tyrosine-type recombinase/integrase, partial [Planctomycetota bacterium]